MKKYIVIYAVLLILAAGCFYFYGIFSSKIKSNSYFIQLYKLKNSNANLNYRYANINKKLYNIKNKNNFKTKLNNIFKLLKSDKIEALKITKKNFSGIAIGKIPAGIKLIKKVNNVFIFESNAKGKKWKKLSL